MGCHPNTAGEVALLYERGIISKDEARRLLGILDRSTIVDSGTMEGAAQEEAS